MANKNLGIGADAGRRAARALLMGLTGWTLAGCMDSPPGLTAAAVAAGPAPPAGRFTLAAPPSGCPNGLQGQVPGCVAAIIINKDATYQTCACTNHGANFSNDPIPPGWQQKDSDTVPISKWVPADHSDPDPCVTYTIGGTLKTVCWQ